MSRFPQTTPGTTSASAHVLGRKLASRATMRRRARQLTLEKLEVRTVLSGTPLATGALQGYGQIPLSFEANLGQAAAEVDFISRGAGYAIALAGNSARIDVSSSTTTSNHLLLQLVGAEPDPRGVGVDRQQAVSNYLVGQDPSLWRTNIANYARVLYEDVYPGIDMVYYGNQRQLEYDFIVDAGVDPSRIAIAIEGAKEITLDGSGNLVLRTAAGELTQHAPIIYQDVNGARNSIPGEFVLRENQVSFHIGDYDTSRPLIIDPILSYSTYLGGSDHENSISVAVDVSGNAYISGTTYSSNFPASGGVQSSGAGMNDAFVTKLSADGGSIVYSTYLGGTNEDEAAAIAVDASGNVYITGSTVSSNFPTTASASQPTFVPGMYMAFVTKLNAAGSALEYSSYLGSRGTIDGGYSNACGDAGSDIAVDAAGNVYVTGTTYSSDFITTPGALQESVEITCANHAFISKFDPSQSGPASLVYSTFLGNSLYGGEFGNGIAIDAAGNAYVTGYVESTDFPTTPGALRTVGGAGTAYGTDGFVAKLNATGSALEYSTYLGGTRTDIGRAIAVDDSGNAYITGVSQSVDFPTSANSWDQTFGGLEDAFITKLNPSGSAVVYSTFVGGSLSEQGLDIAIDRNGNALITGYTESSSFPTAHAVQSSIGGGHDAFLTKINASGSDLLVSTFIGGSLDDFGTSIAVDASGAAYLAGNTESNNFPVTAGAAQQTRTGSGDEAFIAKIDMGFPAPTISIGDATITEGNSGAKFASLTVTRTGDPAFEISVSYATSDGTATAGGDYSGASGMITFDPGVMGITLSISVSGDTSFETDENLFVNLTGASAGATIADPQGTVTIQNDDLPPTKFYVVNDSTTNRTFEYGAGGQSVENYALASGNTAPRGAASNRAGDRIWVLDSNRSVYIYNTSGALLGSWKAGTLASNATPVGIATNGTDLWIVDSKSDKVYKYADAADRVSGNQSAAGSFSLNSGNANPTGIVTDGASLWVVNDANQDKVFKYNTSGTFQGSWAIDAANSAPTGLTIDPADVGHIWIVDRGTRKIYQYDNATTRTSGNQGASVSFELAAGNTNPEDIADPPVSSVSRHAAVAVDFVNTSIGQGKIGGNAPQLPSRDIRTTRRAVAQIHGPRADADRLVPIADARTLSGHQEHDVALLEWLQENSPKTWQSADENK